MSHPHTHHSHGPSATASVVLDIGGDIGALILQADAAHLGREIEISPIARDGAPTPARTHSMVRERRTTPPTYDAVYPDLREGEYVIWHDQDTPAGTVTITGGQISTHRFAERPRATGAAGAAGSRPPGAPLPGAAGRRG